MLKKDEYTIDEAMRVGVPSRTCPHFLEPQPDGSVKTRLEEKCITVELFPFSECGESIGSGYGNFSDYAYTGDYRRTIGQSVCPVQVRDDVSVNVAQEFYFPVKRCTLMNLPKKRKNQWRMVCKAGDKFTDFRLPFIAQGNIVPKYNAAGEMVGLRFARGKAPIYHTKAKEVKMPILPEAMRTEPQQNVAQPQQI